MKLRNKETGEIGNLITICATTRVFVNGESEKVYNSLAELNEEWEDYEEPKDFWFIDSGGEIRQTTYLTQCDKTRLTNFGNYFSSKEEAEKALEKLKAWKRLKDKGFRFDCWYGGSRDILFSIPQEIIDMATKKDIDLLFGGEE